MTRRHPRLRLRAPHLLGASRRRIHFKTTYRIVSIPVRGTEAYLPHPREHGWTYHGSLAPASPLRDRVVPLHTSRTSPSPGDSPNSGSISPTDCDLAARRRAWAELLDRTFAKDLLRCSGCGNRRRRMATITDLFVARRIIPHIGAHYEPLTLAPARPLRKRVLAFE